VKIYLNGAFVDKEKAVISVFDHGLLYGDGVFEGIRAYHGRVFKLKEHIVRLFESARAIMLKMPWSQQEIMEAVVETCRVNGLRDGYIRLVITRGIGTLGLNPYLCENPSIFIIADSIQLYPKELYEKGLDVITVPTIRNHPAALSPAIKSLNYLNNILAKIEAINAGVVEAIMLNSDGYVAECTGDNLFIMKNGTLITTPISSGALRGITRDTIIGLAKEQGIPFQEQVLTRFDLFIADECFLTGTAAEAIPVVKIDGRPVGDGLPGPVTKQLIAKFHGLVQTDGEPIPQP
jgi:branched-chain amino acid aminotransferase